MTEIQSYDVKRRPSLQKEWGSPFPLAKIYPIIIIYNVILYKYTIGWERLE
jgi:hypothetical protein